MCRYIIYVFANQGWYVPVINKSLFYWTTPSYYQSGGAPGVCISAILVYFENIVAFTAKMAGLTQLS